MLRMASSDGLDARGKGCHDMSSKMLEWRRENEQATAHVGGAPSVQSISEASRWRSFVFLVRLSAPLDALLLGEPLPRTPQSRLTQLISCSPAALAVTRTLSVSRAPRAKPPDSACVPVPQIDA